MTGVLRSWGFRPQHRRKMVWPVVVATMTFGAFVWAISHTRLAACASPSKVASLEEESSRLKAELRRAQAESHQVGRELAQAKRRVSTLQAEATLFQAEAAKHKEDAETQRQALAEAIARQASAQTLRLNSEDKIFAAEEQLHALRAAVEAQKKVHR